MNQIEKMLEIIVGLILLTVEAICIKICQHKMTVVKIIESEQLCNKYIC